MNDILLNEEDDLQFRGGDFVVEHSARQHQRHLIIADKGNYKQHPLIGVGAAGYLMDENQEDLIREIHREISRDGQKITTLTISPTGLIEIAADFK
jgi:hypothetical protein